MWSGDGKETTIATRRQQRRGALHGDRPSRVLGRRRAPGRAYESASRSPWVIPFPSCMASIVTIGTRTSRCPIRALLSTYRRSCPGGRAPLAGPRRERHTRARRASALASVTLSPDGRQAAGDLVDGTKVQVWVFDLERGAKRLLVSEGDSRQPIWSRDGRFITYWSKRDDNSVFRKRADGTAPRSC